MGEVHLKKHGTNNGERKEMRNLEETVLKLKRIYFDQSVGY